MVTTQSSSRDLINYSFITSGKANSAETYCNQLDNMMKNLEEKQPKLVNRDGQFSYMIMPAHTLQIGRNYKYWNWISKPSIIFRIHRTFPHLIIICFGIWISSYKERYSIPNRLSKMPSALSPVPNFQTSMQKGINKLPFKWQKCIDASGAYCHVPVTINRNIIPLLQKLSINSFYKMKSKPLYRKCRQLVKYKSLLY